MEIQVFADKHFFYGAVGAQHPPAYDRVKSLGEQSPMDGPVNAALNTAGFILRRRSKVVGRSRGLIVSCIGYVDLPNKAMRILRLTRHEDIFLLFRRSEGWKKGEARVSSIFYKDSPVSGFIARRAFKNNDYSLNEMVQAGIDAEWRAQAQASANPALINGSPEEFEEYDQDGHRRCINF